MSRRKRILVVMAMLLFATVVAAGITLSHDSACGAGRAPPAVGATMRAVVRRCYGGPEVLRIERVARPVPTDEQVLVRVHAAAINPLDWHYLRGQPYIMRLDAGIGAPDDPAMGVDFAGTVEAVGRKVTRFEPGDEVFGGRSGALAEYVAVREAGAIVHKPPRLDFTQAAAVPIAAVTALQALRDKGLLQRGQKVLVNGASGGVGSFAVQLAHAFGAEVTGVCSTRNVELVRALGADHVIDYTRADFADGSAHYDLIVDNVGNRDIGELRRALVPRGIYVAVGGSSEGHWIGPLSRSIAGLLVDPFVSQEFPFLLAQLDARDLGTLAGILQAGQITPLVDRTYPLEQAAEAIRYLETGRARGKVVITVGAPPAAAAAAEPQRQ